MDERLERYAAGHADRVNLLIHIVAVPLFVLASISALAALLTGRWLLLAAALAGVGLSLAAQGAGHTRETVPPEPFAGPGDFVQRIIKEQFLTFWHFAGSGGWLSNVRLSQ